MLTTENVSLRVQIENLKGNWQEKIGENQEKHVAITFHGKNSNQNASGADENILKRKKEQGKAKIAIGKSTEEVRSHDKRFTPYYRKDGHGTENSINTSYNIFRLRNLKIK